MAALAQQQSGQAGRTAGARGGTVPDESMDDTDRPIIVEMPATGGGAGTGGSGTGGTDTGSGQAGVGVEVYRPRPNPGTGGSGGDTGAASQADAPNQEVFQGTLRSVTADRLRMLDGTGRVYEFGLGAQTRILGPDGAAVSRQALREGMVVRTVTQPGELENEVLSVQVFGRVPVPSR
jgi:hypothetical protein